MKNEDVARGMTERIIEKLSCYNVTIDESKWQNYKMLEIEKDEREKNEPGKEIGWVDYRFRRNRIRLRLMLVGFKSVKFFFVLYGQVFNWKPILNRFVST